MRRKQAPGAKYGIVVSAEVARALRDGAPVVALESTIISHGMPYPQNLATAQAVEAVVRKGALSCAAFGGSDLMSVTTAWSAVQMRGPRVIRTQAPSEVLACNVHVLRKGIPLAAILFASAPTACQLQCCNIRMTRPS